MENLALKPTHSPESIVLFVRSLRLPMQNEKATQADLESHLLNEGYDFLREYRLSEGNIVDFFFPETGTALEIKLKAPKRTIFRQLKRYCEHDEIKGLIVASGTFMGLPQDVEGKPVWFVSLSQNWAF